MAFEDAGSNVKTGVGSNSLTFTLPATPRYFVQSVVATVDNTAGGDTTAQVTVKDVSGQVIATKTQGEVIPAGDTGTATFALRLDDNGGVIRFDKLNLGGYLLVEATGPDGIEFDADTGPLTLFGDSVQVVSPGTVTLSSNVNHGWFFADRPSGTTRFSVPTTAEPVAPTASLQVYFRLRQDQRFEIRDHSGNPIFRVNEDGSLQGKTGAALTFDLP